MKYTLLLKLFFITSISLANMAKPWIDGSTHSLLYTADNCIVKYEIINLDLSNPYYADYNITYTIYSDQDVLIPLLFIGINLEEEKNIKINNSQIQTIPILEDTSKFSFISKDKDYEGYFRIKYAENNSIRVEKKDLIYFKANLKKGNNTIQINYKANLEVNRFGFLSRSKLEYSLYPSKFWKSFGTIEVNLNLGDKLKITQNNIGKPVIKNNIATWKIETIENDTIEMNFEKKESIISSALIALDPIGIASIFLILVSFFNVKNIKQKIINKDKNYKYYLPASVFLIGILFYTVWYLSFGLIDFSLGRTTRHGYYFLFFFTYPIFVLIYGIIMLIVSIQIKKKVKLLNSKY